MKKTLLFIILIYYIIPVFCFAQNQNREYQDLGQAFGYLNGQEITLAKIEKEFPSLGNDIKLAKIEFGLSFGNAEKNIENNLKDLLGDQFEEYKSNLLEQTENMLSSQEITEELAIDFINKVKRRSDGEIESPVLETLLIYQYSDFPVSEFNDGYAITYSTQNHQKSKGLDIRIKIPESWKNEEADRPNIVQKFISKNGTGKEIIQIIVKEIPTNDYQFTKSDIDEFYSGEMMKEMLPDESKFIEAKKIVLDNNSGGQIIFEQNIQRLDILVKTKAVEYSTIIDNKMILLQCTVSSVDDENLDSRFEKYFPLFKQVANSLVFMNQY
ncbi:hypothetical protein [Gracilimonas mengyeensis]|uniref:Uncharacterized protein n=1 Tax=Gracilimonas mengyeensis TaxID=1302730 RepID=A0A521ETI0_9BACT|nr:hypothetical protein [Gracilimonas mengyeensis]SMO87233.1 hypothetical protein SAMN06265219_113138 [Gracilimonas mengyeensis]